MRLKPSFYFIPVFSPPNEWAPEAEPEWSDEDDAYVPDDELIAACELPAPPPLPSDTDLESAADVLAPHLPTRPLMAYHLGRDRYVTLSRFRGGLNFHVREYGTNDLTLAKYPTPKGVCLDHVQVRALIHHIDDVRTRVHHSDIATEANWHLGKLTFVGFNPEYTAIANLRHFFIPENEKRLQATKRGVTLNKHEIDNLARVLTETLEAAWPALQLQTTPCFVDHAEHNDEERAKRQCPYCAPLMDI